MRPVKCVLVGDGAVGKTSLLISYTTNSFPQDYIPTVFDNYSTTIVLPEAAAGPDQESQVFKLNLWDTAGQEEYDRLRPLSYPQTDIFLVCFSVVERSSLRNVTDKWFPEIRENCSSGNAELLKRLGKRPMLLVGTKTDLRDREEEETFGMKSASPDYVSAKEAAQVAEQCGFMGYVECSAALQLGVREVFECAVRSCVYEPQRLLEEQDKKEQSQRQAVATEEEGQQQRAQKPQKKKSAKSIFHTESSVGSKKTSPPASSAASSTPASARQQKLASTSSKYLHKAKKSSSCVIL